MSTSQRTALYRLFNAADDLLYIGITWQRLADRMTDHAGEQRWWHEVHHATALWYETREDADQAETEAIKAERPKYNIAKTKESRPRKPGPTTRPGQLEPLVKNDADGRWIRVPPGVGVEFVFPPSVDPFSDSGALLPTSVSVLDRDGSTRRMPAALVALL